MGMRVYEQSDIDASIQLGKLADMRAQLERDIGEHVAEWRRTGATWSMIGIAVGTTTQAAWERYGSYVRPGGSRWTQPLMIDAVSGIPSPFEELREESASVKKSVRKQGKRKPKAGHEA
jgi:hypothetical protein